MAVKIIGYLSYGYPDLETSIRRARLYREGGCRCIEVDFPTDDPYLDNAFIQSRMKAAYAACADFGAYFDGVERIKACCPDTELIALCYEHTVLEIGVETFIRRFRQAGLDALILVGNRDDHVKKQLLGAGLKISSYVTYALPEAEVEDARTANGFVYLQAKPDGTVRPGCESLAQCVRHLRQSGIGVPIYCGVGVSTPQDIREIRLAGGDGAFIGSALLKQPSDEETVRYLRALARQAE